MFICGMVLPSTLKLGLSLDQLQHSYKLLINDVKPDHSLYIV